MSEWHNYGDIGFLEEGGTQIRKAFSPEEIAEHPSLDDVYDFFRVEYREGERYAFRGAVHLDDYKNDEEFMERLYAVNGFSKNEEIPDDLLAAYIVETVGTYEFSPTNYEGKQSDNLMDFLVEDDMVLAQWMQELGIEVNPVEMSSITKAIVQQIIEDGTVFGLAFSEDSENMDKGILFRNGFEVENEDGTFAKYYADVSVEGILTLYTEDEYEIVLTEQQAALLTEKIYSEPDVRDKVAEQFIRQQIALHCENGYLPITIEDIEVAASQEDMQEFAREKYEEFKKDSGFFLNFHDYLEDAMIVAYYIPSAAENKMLQTIDNAAASSERLSTILNEFYEKQHDVFNALEECGYMGFTFDMNEMIGMDLAEFEAQQQAKAGKRKDGVDRE